MAHLVPFGPQNAAQAVHFHAEPLEIYLEQSLLVEVGHGVEQDQLQVHIEGGFRVEDVSLQIQFLVFQ